MADARVRRRGDGADALLPYLPRMTPRVYTGLVGWVLCVYLLLAATPPATPPERLDRYRELMSFASTDPGFHELEREMLGLLREQDEHKVLFWSWRSPYKERVREKQAQIDELAPRYDAMVADREATRVQARQQVGLWSEVGVGEMRALFWKSWQEGKDFAKRMTFWCAPPPAARAARCGRARCRARRARRALRANRPAAHARTGAARGRPGAGTSCSPRRGARRPSSPCWCACSPPSS